MIKIHEVEQGSEAWIELRRGLYTGSNADKLLKYGAVNYALNEENSKFKGNFFTKRGHILEDEALEFYEQINKCTVKRHGFITNSLYPQCGYSPDGIDKSTLLEVKCFNETGHKAIYKGEIPFKILAQIYFGLFICALDEARLIIYNPDLEAKYAFKTLHIKGDKDINNNFKRILKESKHAIYT